MLRTIAVIVLLGVLGACSARTDITSFIDPAFPTDAGIDPVAVMTEDMTLTEEIATEDSAAAALAKHGIAVLRGTAIAPPTRGLSTAERLTAARAAGASTILVIAATGKTEEQRYVPPTYPTPFLHHHGFPCYDGLWHGHSHCFAGFYHMRRHHLYHLRDGHTVTTPNATYAMRLIDAESGAELWRAEAQSRGVAGADFADLGRDMAADTVRRLRADGIF